MNIDNDLAIPERNEFHDWYLEKYGEEYPYTYSEMFRKLTGREGQAEQVKVRTIVDEYEKEKAVGSMRSVANALKTPFYKIVSKMLTDIGLTREDQHERVMNLIPKWKDLSDAEQLDIGKSIAGMYRLAEFLMLMSDLSVEETQ